MFFSSVSSPLRVRYFHCVEVESLRQNRYGGVVLCVDLVLSLVYFVKHHMGIIVEQREHVNDSLPALARREGYSVVCSSRSRLFGLISVYYTTLHVHRR